MTYIPDTRTDYAKKLDELLNPDGLPYVPPVPYVPVPPVVPLPPVWPHPHDHCGCHCWCHPPTITWDRTTTTSVRMRV